MEREQLEQHQATLRGLKDTVASNRDGFDENVTPALQREAIFSAIDGVADVVLALIEERLEASKYAAAVKQEMKRSTGLDEALNSGDGSYRP